MNLSVINHRIPLDTVYEDEASDSLSSEEFSQNFSPRSNKENNPYYQQQFNTDCDSESTMTSQTKKIRKKRTAYQKIDDDIRIQLWEAVQQNGESLKCAAKRLNINYSSAKSILHTYRKEGRILKKSALERPIKAYDFGSYEPEAVQFTLPPLSFSEFIPNKNHGYQQNVQNIEVYQESTTTTSFGGNSPSSPMHGLADNLCQISLENQDPNRDQRFNDQMFMPKPQLPSLRPINKPKLPLGEIINESTPNANTGTPSPIIPAFRLPSNHQPGNPLDALKHLDNFYMNYSNSPLSGNNKMYQECSDSGSRSKFQKEFESFSDMVNCLQSSNRPVDESKGDIQIPKPMKLNPMQIMQDKVDSQMIREESPVWTKNLENAAFDTYKSFMDANWLLQDAIKKANQLNTFVHLQKSGISPTNQWQM